MKKLLLLLLLPFAALAQQGSPQFGGVHYRVQDSAAYVAAQPSQHAAGYADIWYSDSSDLWWVWDGSQYVNWSPSGAAPGTVSWDDIVGKPTTLAGYGITDGATDGELLAHTSNTSNPHSVTKTQVGLGNVDNTSDVSKPVSTAQQTEIDSKVFVYYANDYGLIADANGTTGNGTDNAIALGTLVDLVLANGGGTIRLGEGIYRYTGVLNKTGNNVTIEGIGMGVSTLFCDNTSVNLYAVFINGNNNHHRNYTIQGRETFQSNGVGLYVSGSNSSADHVEVKEANCFGIFVSFGSNITISNCVIHDCAADGIHVANTVSRVQVINNNIYTCADDGIGIGFEGTTNNILVEGNNIFETSAGIAIMGFSATGVSPDVYNITVANNNINTTWLSGILVHISQGSIEGVNITGNTIRNSGGFVPRAGVGMRGVGESYGIACSASPLSGTTTMRNVSITSNNIFTARNCFISVGYLLSGSSTGLLRDIKVSGNIMQGISAVGGAGSWGFGAGGSSANPDGNLYPGIVVRNVIGNIDVSNNQIRGANMNAALLESTCTGQISLVNNQSFDCNAGSATAYAYQLASTSSATSAVVKGNTYLGTAFSTGIASIGTGTTVLEYSSPQELLNQQSGTSYTIVTNDIGKIVSLSNSAARAVTMPSAGAWPEGKVFWVKDAAGSAATGNITLTRAGSDTFEGAGTTNVISTNYETRGYYHLLGSAIWYTTSLAPATGGGGVDQFTELVDVPASYSGQATKIVTVKGDESGLEFVTAPAGLNLSGYVAVTGATGLSTGDFNKSIICSGTSADYAVTLPTAVGNTGNWFDFVGVTGLTKIVTVDANSTETINGLTVNRPFTGRGGFRLVSDGANWQVISEKPSWIAYTATWTGTSGQPSAVTLYSLVGKQMTIAYGAAATAPSGTGLSFSIPSGYTVNTTNYQYSRVMSGGSYVSTGMAEAATTSINLFLTGAGGSISGTGNKAATGFIIFDIQ